MSVLADLDEFLGDHQGCAPFASEVGEITGQGYTVRVACPCGVVFERRMLPQDAAEDLWRLRQRLEKGLTRL